MQRGKLVIFFKLLYAIVINVANFLNPFFKVIEDLNSLNHIVSTFKEYRLKWIRLHKRALERKHYARSFPKEIGNAASMQVISLRQNNLTGFLPPSLGNLSTLTTIDLSYNKFQGQIPMELGHLRNLERLSFSFDNFSGHIPTSLYNVSTLTFLSLTGNDLSGTLPSDIAEGLPSIQAILVGMNRLTGQIPASISNASKLANFSVGNNFLSGHIPETLGTLPLLENLILDYNQFTIDPSSNLEIGFLPKMMRIPTLRVLQIGYNPLNGVLPNSLFTSGNGSSFEKLHVPGSGLKGVIPSDIANLSNLYWLSLAENELTGKIPYNIGSLRSLQRLRIDDNRIGGEIPSGICNLELYGLYLSNNFLSGEIPSCLGNVSSLREPHLDSNALTSPLALSFWSNTNLMIVNLSSNFLSGTLGLQIGRISGLRELYLDGNMFSGEIPTSIGDLQDLVNLSLARNAFSGRLPQELGNLSSLEYLDLSNNNISGEIPKSMEVLHLVFLNLSFNELSGEIPSSGPFQTFAADSFVGNIALCGPSRFQVLLCKKEESSRQHKVLKYVLPFCALSLFLAIGLSIWLLKFRNKNSTGNEENNLELRKRVSYIEILRGTSNFDETNLVGKGSYGVVYKANLSNEMTVAIKVFNLERPGGLKSFDVECEVVRNVRHRNLVKVISTCSNLDFKAIIFEFMPNGSLEHWLHSPDKCLDIIQRLGVMIDVASALEYLHHGYFSPMVHCDVKPSNVLFDIDMIARLGDFGIAKLIARDAPVVLTHTLGTMGYIAPEYGSEGIVSTMADVYSFGILLMETFTGRKPTYENFTDDLTITKWVSKSSKDQIMEIIDPKLLTETTEEVDAKRDFFSSIMQLALACTEDSPENRINMVNVLARLKKIKYMLH